MLQTVEAEVDANGVVRLLEPLTVTKPTRAIVTLLEDQPNGEARAAVENKGNARQVLEFLQSSKFKNRKSYSPEEIEAQIEEARNSRD